MRPAPNPAAPGARGRARCLQSNVRGRAPLSSVVGRGSKYALESCNLVCDLFWNNRHYAVPGLVSTEVQPRCVIAFGIRGCPRVRIHFPLRRAPRFETSEQMIHQLPNHCVQATPDYALLFIVARVSGAPDATRSSLQRRAYDPRSK
jgi:hypothetical protein